MLSNILGKQYGVAPGVHGAGKPLFAVIGKSHHRSRQ